MNNTDETIECFCRAELSADEFPRGNLMFSKQIFAREAKVRGQIC